ncbi:hypothetical protein SNE40_020014 [Patella caerulea]|uniref:C2H2-type domain-containing protein n=1 Tax=Patella caerulea TaxID=87958 RepID=A0AAN8IZ71_PATCE
MMNPEESCTCGLCQEVFPNRRKLKNHLAAAPHQRLKMVCVWCDRETSFRRMVDLKSHMKTDHSEKLKLMPEKFLSENNGFWMSYHPEDYGSVIQPSSRNSEEAMKARMEILAMIDREGCSRTKDQWYRGWEFEERNAVTKRTYSPSRPGMYEDLTLRNINIMQGNTNAIFSTEVGIGAFWVRIIMDDAVNQWSSKK